MKKKCVAAILPAIGMLVLSILFASCATQKAAADKSMAQGDTSSATAMAATAPAAEPAAAASAKPEDLYKQKIKPLAPVECARCHASQFNKLVDKGLKHRFECTNCHEQFHAYNPRKNNYDTIMPKCQNCHGLLHGDGFPNCMQCHQEPHTPREIPFTAVSQKAKGKDGKETIVCGVCHEGIGSEFTANPSKHNVQVGCEGCHAEKHGVKPVCFDCHEPHVKGQEYKDCLVCHSPHSALKIKQYPEETANAVCGSCHSEVYSNLQTNHTKHSELQCATCHVAHGKIPQCQDCHGLPHGEGLHKRFGNCLDCHMDPHNLPVNMKK